MRVTTRDQVAGRELGLPVALALLSSAAAGIHGAVIGEHLEEYAPFGLFFAVIASAQVLWATAVVVRFDRSTLFVGLAGNAVVIALWAISRTTGLPVGPHPWHPETVATIDALCTIAEGLIVVACLVVFARSERSGRPTLVPFRPRWRWS